AALTFGLAACSDTVTDPSSAAALRPSGAHMILATTTVTTALVDPRIDNVYVSETGDRLVIPAYAICSLTSGYGPQFWNQSCTPASAPILFTITSSIDTFRHAKLTVQPDVRFSPSKAATASLHQTAAPTRR